MNRSMFSPMLPLKLIGGALVLLGATVAAGWMLKISELVRIIPEFAAMVFNTALCFILLGAALMQAARPPAWRQRVQILLGGLTVLIAALVLSQDLFSIDIGIDHLFSADWLEDTRAHATRMAPNSAIAFILGGATLILLNLGRARWTGYVSQFMALAVGLIGSAALLGYVLKLEFLFTWYPYAHMAVHTASGITLLGIGLWGCWRCARNKVEQTNSPDTRIIFTGSVILVVMALTAGIGGFLMLVQQTEDTLKRGLHVSLINHVEVYRDTLSNAVINVRDIASRPAIQKELQRLRVTPGHPEALDFLRRAISSYIGLGMSAVALDDAYGHRLTQAGEFARTPALRVPLNLSYRPELLWVDGLVMHTRVPVIVDKKFLGTITAEQTLPLLNQMFDNVRGLGETGEMVLCAMQRNEIACFPTRLHPEAFTVPRRMKGNLLPMARALDGIDDVSLAMDFRGNQVIAAYGPIYQTDLGLVIKMNVEELYQPIHRQFEQILILLLALTVGGILLLRWQVLPLARRLVESERQTLQANQSLKNQELFLRSVIDNLPTALFCKDIHDGYRFTLWNNKSEEMFGLRREQVLGKNDYDFFPKQQADSFRQKDQEVVRQDRVVDIPEEPVDSQSQGRILLHTIKVPVPDIEGKPRYLLGISQDITARKQAEETLRLSEERLRMVMENATDAIITINEQGLIESFNTAAMKIFGYGREQAIGQNIKMLMPESLQTPHESGMHRYLQSGEAHVVGMKSVEMQGLRRDGTEFPLELGVNEARLGEKRLFIGILRDITARKQTEQTIREMSLVDELTQLRNRRGFMALAEAELALARRMKRDLAVYYADLDGLKAINDNHGHAEGDRALKNVADILLKTFRDSDIIARLGGDEFAVLALETVQHKPELIIQRLETRLAEYNRAAGQPYALSLSMGAVYVKTDSRISIDEIMARADAEMYRVKQARCTGRTG